MDPRDHFAPCPSICSGGDQLARVGRPDRASEPDDRHVIVIAVVGTQTVGFLVNAVADIIGINQSEVQPTPDVASDATRAFIEGVIVTEERMLRVIDIKTVLPKSMETAEAG